MWARASALHRHMECPAASWLPRDERQEWVPGYLVDPSTAEVPNDEVYPCQGDSIFAEWGTQMHLAKENSPFASDPWLSYLEPHRERLWPASLGRHEVSVSYNCRTGKVFEGPAGSASGSDSWKGRRGPDEVTGTTDWIGRIPSGDLWIDDLKTGHATPDPLSVQFKFYALCFARIQEQAGLVQLTPRRIVRTSATHWRRGDDNPTRYWAQISGTELEEFEEELLQAWRRATKGPVAIPGTHCLYCPSLDVCEAINGIRRVELKKARIDNE